MCISFINFKLSTITILKALILTNYKFSFFHLKNMGSFVNFFTECTRVIWSTDHPQSTLSIIFLFLFKILQLP